MTNIHKDREVTEKRLLKAVGDIIEEKGMEFLGINIVAQKAGVSKILIYRYFGSLEELIANYILQHDFWVNVPTYIPQKSELNSFVKKLFSEQIKQLREDILFIRLLRWELSTHNSIIEKIRKQREENGIKLVQFVSDISGAEYEEIQVLATLISSSITYLAILADNHHVYNGLPINTEKGWNQLEKGINKLIDRCIPA